MMFLWRGMISYYWRDMPIRERLTPKEKAERERQRKIHMGRVASLGCIVCAAPANVHHIRDGQGTGQKASDYETIGLCHNHHQGRDGIHTLGTKRWQKIYGYERELLENVRRELIGRYGSVKTGD